MIGFLTTLLENAPGWLERLRPALFMTLAVTAASFVAASLLAIGLELARQSRTKAARWAARACIDFVRCVPILAILYLLYFGLPGIGIAFSSFVAGTIGLALVYSTYIAEVLRGGVSAIHRGQREAAIAAGLTPLMTFRYIVLPQALRVMAAPLLVTFISLLKDSSICALIAVNELMLTSKVIMSETFMPLHVFVLVGAIYFAVAWPMSLLARWIERRLARASRSAAIP
ncbi:amino acid ABC transporter permease [Dongia sp.]|uniref:amino acid ABC transporter permease n=1 Tax=Dongia sp. TaxID=1977262 RepID=UPI00375347D1